MCFGFSKEWSHRDGSFEYPQPMFWIRDKENIFPIHTLIWRPEYMLIFEIQTCDPPGVQNLCIKPEGRIHLYTFWF